MRQRRPAVPHRVVAQLADRQHGVAATRQLLGLGIGADAIQRRIADGRYVPVFWGVVAIGHARLRREGRWMAAVLAGGDDAALSHVDTLAARGIVPSNARRIHVTVPRLTGGAHPRDGLVLHRCKLEPQDRDMIDGIPTTTVARALLDFAETAPYRQLERAIDEAYKQRLFDLDATRDLLERARGRRGIKPLRRAIELYVPEPHHTRSWLERRALRLIREAGLPMPQVNLNLNGHEVDLQWPQANLVVELDSREHHDTPWAREEDSIRDARQVAHGHGVMRVTHRRLTREPGEVVALIRQRLSGAGAAR
jgi:very-short-patch-repair endonuclease